MSFCLLTKIFIFILLEWSNGIEGPFLIRLITGKTSATMVPTSIKLRGEGTKGFYDWTVAKGLTDGSYAFQFTFKNNGKT